MYRNELMWCPNLQI